MHFLDGMPLAIRRRSGEQATDRWQQDDYGASSRPPFDLVHRMDNTRIISLPIMPNLMLSGNRHTRDFRHAFDSGCSPPHGVTFEHISGQPPVTLFGIPVARRSLRAVDGYRVG